MFEYASDLARSENKQGRKVLVSKSHDVLLLERGYLIKKLIMLIPCKICYRPVLQHARNYEKKVKAPLVHY